MRTSLKIFFFVFLQFVISAFYTHFIRAQLVPDFRVNDDTTSFPHINAKVDTDINGNFVIVWEDKRITGITHIYCQRYNSIAQPIGNNFMIDSEADTSLKPAICMRSDGSFIISWYFRLVKARIFNSKGVPISDYFIVSDTPAVANPSICCDTVGNFVISWQQYVSQFRPLTYFQRYNYYGCRIGNNIKVTDYHKDHSEFLPSVTVRRKGSFIITWLDTREGTGNDVYMQMYDSSANRIGVNTRVNDSASSDDQFHNPKVTSDSIGRFVIGFSHYILNENQSDAKLQFYNSNGNKNGNNLSLYPSSSDEGFLVFSKRKNGDMVVGIGLQTVFGFTPFCQRIKADMTFMGNLFLISSTALQENIYYSDVKLYNDKIISVWSDESNSNLDVYCNIRSFVNPDSTVNIQQISNEVPTELQLFQNYPNPFNPETKIKFNINRSGKITLKIFDILGKEIAVLLDKSLASGKYIINVTSNKYNLASGIYFYSLITDNKILSKKMTVIK